MAPTTKKYALIATAASLSGTSGVMVATIGLEEFFSAFKQDHLPSGLEIRLLERDNESRATTAVKSIIGELEASPDTVFTEVIRIASGQAKWDLYWDFKRNYLSGGVVSLATLVQIGGSLLTVLAIGLFGVLSFQNIRFHMEVNERTAELSRNSMLIQLTMDSIDQGFAVWNSDQRLVVWSQRCVEFWYHPGDILRAGMHMKELLGHIAKNGGFGLDRDEAIIETELNRVITAGESSEDMFRMANGDTIHVRRFPLEKGGHVAVYTDVTDREAATKKLTLTNRELQHQRDRAEHASKAKSEFLAHMSHELRTPLNAIIGFAEALEHGIDAGDETKHREFLGHIANAGRDLNDLIGGVLDFSQIEEGQFRLEPELLSPASVMQECLPMIQQMAESKGIEFKGGRKSNAYIEVDRARLKQIMLNLISNAVKYNVPEGNIEFGCHEVNENRLRIYVTDSGIGIPEHLRDRVFEPFHRLRMSDHDVAGSGIGLSITRKLVEIMGGEIDFESQANIGSTFWVEFPIAARDDA